MSSSMLASDQLEGGGEGEGPRESFGTGEGVGFKIELTKT